jgi:4,5-DOPA dioxygenase extradiol
MTRTSLERSAGGAKTEEKVHGHAEANSRDAGPSAKGGITTSDSKVLKRMPALFIGHGNPMNALLVNRYTQRWADIGTSLPRPKAILSVSAHWYIEDAAVTVSTAPKTIHDFGGFPRELYLVQYPAPGDSDLAARVQKMLAPVPVRRDDRWGLDHGTWSVLRHVHNLHAYAWGAHAPEPYDWAISFETRVRELLLAGEYKPLVSYERQLGSEAELAVPTPDHYLPLLYVVGTRAATEPLTFPVEGVDGGSVSMLAVQVG